MTDELMKRVDEWFSDNDQSMSESGIIQQASTLIEDLQAALTASQQEMGALDDALSITHADLAAAQEEIKRLRDVVRFYANEKAYYDNPEHPATKGRVILDKGQYARQALAQQEGDV